MTLDKKCTLGSCNKNNKIMVTIAPFISETILTSSKVLFLRRTRTVHLHILFRLKDTAAINTWHQARPTSLDLAETDNTDLGFFENEVPPQNPMVDIQ